MRSLEQVFNFAQDTANLGKPITSKKETVEDRVEPVDLREMFVTDEVTNNCVNIWTQLIFSSEHNLSNTSLDLFLDAVGDIGNPTTWDEMEYVIFQNAIVYGSAWIELIYGRTNGKIVDLVSVNPEKMDYAKDGRGRVAIDKYSRPLGYVHKVPHGFTAARTQKVPEGVVIRGTELFIPPKNMAHIKFPINVGDGLRPYGLIEPGYKSLKRRKELEESYATALDKALPVRVGKYGDQMNRPTPQKLKDLLEIVTNLRGKTDAAALPYHSTIEMLESKGIQNMLEPLKYYLSLGIAPFGIPISLAVGIGEECYSEDTRTLTENGLKYYWEIGKDEKIATYNPETGKLEYVKPTYKKVHKYAGKMHHYKNSVIDVLVTPEHKMYYRTMKSDTWVKEKSRDITQSRIKFKNKVSFEGLGKEYFYLKEVPYEEQSRIKNNGKDYKLDMNAWLEFLGYFISEGYVRIHKGNYGVEISQINTENIEKIRNCLEKLPFKYVEKKARNRIEGFRINNKSLAIYLYNNCGVDSYTRKIPKEFLELNKNQLNVLFDALILGDGSSFGTSGKVYYTVSNTLRDNVLELFLKLGYSTSTDKQKQMYRVSGNMKHYEPRINLKTQRTEEDYDGIVYCFEVPNHLFITERGGKIAIQGNTNRSTLNVLRDIYSKRIKVVVSQISNQIERQIFRPVSESNGNKKYPRYEWDEIVLRTEDIDNTDKTEKPVSEELEPKKKEEKKDKKFVF